MNHMQRNTKKVAWPPRYSIRRSKRAKHVSLRFIPGHGLEVVLPEWAETRQAAESLERSKQWVLRHLEKYCLEELETGSGQATFFALPQEFYLHGKTVLARIEWGTGQSARQPVSARPGVQDNTFDIAGNKIQASTLGQPGNSAVSCSTGKMDSVQQESPLPQTKKLIQLHLKTGSPAQQHRYLILWLKNYARNYFGERVAALSEKYGLPYSRLRIGLQKSRWGSYSSQGVISLNAKLVFFPPRVSDAIILHELCHSVAMNHSSKFWQKMKELNPEAVILDRNAASCSGLIPSWARAPQA